MERSLQDFIKTSKLVCIQVLLHSHFFHAVLSSQRQSPLKTYWRKARGIKAASEFVYMGTISSRLLLIDPNLRIQPTMPMDKIAVLGKYICLIKDRKTNDYIYDWPGLSSTKFSPLWHCMRLKFWSQCLKNTRESLQHLEKHNWNESLLGEFKLH